MNRLLPMVSAEFLKLRTRRGLMALSLFLTVGMVIVANVFLLANHASNPVKYGPAGGLDSFLNNLTLFSITTSLAGVLIGATAGAQDIGSGVFRSLVATGQSRIRLALVRIPGALLVFLPMLAIGFGLEVLAAFVFADGTATPDASTILVAAGWLAIVAVLNLTVGLGLAALLKARGIAIGVLIAWQLAAARAIEHIPALGNARVGISSVALDRFLPGATDTIQLSRSMFCTSPTSCTQVVDSLTVGIALAAAVVIAWIAVATVAGVWRTATQDA
jgi:ABC-type transport system involved in multi-copper enzyme maturation permease subunit